jgi:hypothetical protein
MAIDSGTVDPSDDDSVSPRGFHPAEAFRPFWMTGWEPAWCTYGHFDDDSRDDKRHVGTPAEIRLSLMDPYDFGEHVHRERRFEPARVRFNLVQRLTEAEPAVWFYRDIHSTTPWVTCTLAEASDLATRLTVFADRGEEALPSTPAPEGSPFWLATACPHWCEHTHQPYDQDEDRLHMSGVLDDSGRMNLQLEHAIGGEVADLNVSLYRHYRDAIGEVSVSKSGEPSIDLTPAEARTLACHLRRLAESGRGRSSEAVRFGTSSTSDRRPPNAKPVGHYRCPRRVTWCDGHGKQEIEFARRGDILLHRGVVGEVPFTMGTEPGAVRVAIEYDDDPLKEPYACIQIGATDDGIAELDVAAVDQLITTLQELRAAVVTAQADMTALHHGTTVCRPVEAARREAA